MAYQLAQINVGQIVDLMDSEAMFGFASRLDEINALAESAPGFIWRLKDTAGNDATSIHVFDDPYMLINMSVWESLETLFKFTYKTVHTELLRGRRDWFNKMSTPFMALWWIPEGHVPTTDEAKAKLEYLETHGVTPHAFTFKERYTVEEWQEALAAEGVS